MNRLWRMLTSAPVAAAAGAVVLILGLVVILGWLFESRLVVQLHQNWAPMQANTALGFVLLGVALLSARMRWWVACLLTVLATVTLMQYVLGRSIGIDELFIADAFTTVKTSHSGRMSVATGTCFCVLGLACLTLLRYPALASVLAGLVVSVSSLALLGYLMRVELTYSFGLSLFTQMACHTAIGMAIGSMGVLSLAWRQQPQTNRRAVLTMVLGLLVTGFSLAIHSQSLGQYHQLERTMVENADALIRESLHNRELALRRMGDRSFAGSYQNQTFWSKDVQSYLDDFPDLLAMSWRQPDGQVEVVSKQGIDVTPIIADGEGLSWMLSQSSGALPYLHLTYTVNGQSLSASYDPNAFWNVEQAKTQILGIETGASDDVIATDPELLHIEHGGLMWHAEVFSPEVAAARFVIPILVAGLLATWLLWYLTGTLHRLTGFRDALANRNNELNASNKELLQSRNEAELLAEDARAASLAKSRFLAQMSHELRTPLNAIIGFSRQLEPRTEGRVSTAIGRVRANGEHLLELINSLLDLAKIESGKMGVELSSFDTTEITDEIFSALQSLADEKGLQFSCDHIGDGVLLHTDRMKCKQIITNMVANALKYTQKGFVRIETSSSQDQELGSCFVCRVFDSGPGIPPSEQASLFEAFVQGDVRVRAVGTGLGLSVSKQFADLLHGSLRLEHSDSNGSCFALYLPLTPSEALSSASDRLRVQELSSLPES